MRHRYDRPIEQLAGRIWPLLEALQHVLVLCRCLTRGLDVGEIASQAD